MLRILFLEWDSFGQEYIKQEFYRAGYETIDFSWPFGKEDMRTNTALADRLSEVILEGNYAFVFSLNFFPVAAMTCFGCGIKYAAWVYDSPFMLMYSLTLGLSTNYVYLFDKSEYEKFKSYGVNTVHYLPLAAPVSDYDQITDNSATEIFRSEVSFVGSTYEEDKQNFMKWLMPADDYTQGYLEGIMMMQHQIQEGFLLEELLTDEIVEKLEKACPIELTPGEWETKAWIYANYFLARRTTAIDRVCALRALSEFCQVKLYTPEKTLNLPGVENMGTVDYNKEFPKVIKNSDINLNITLRSIHTGIPLRAMDIMGCGGFLLTDYQEDFLEFFEPGVDYVYYLNEEDLCEKVKYYLEHEEERKQIARNGYEKVKAGHTYYHRVRSILADVMSQEDIELLEKYEKIIEYREKSDSDIWYVYLNKSKVSFSDKDLRTGTRTAFANMEAEREAWIQIKEIAIQKVNCYLAGAEKQDWDKIVILLNHKIVREMMVFFPEFTYIKSIAQLYLKEKDSNFIFFQQFKKVEDLEWVYRRISFYFLRLEFDLMDQQDIEFCDYIVEHHISSNTLLFILADNNKFKNKKKILDRLTAILQGS